MSKTIRADDDNRGGDYPRHWQQNRGIKPAQAFVVVAAVLLAQTQENPGENDNPNHTTLSSILHGGGPDPAVIDAFQSPAPIIEELNAEIT